MCGILPRPSSPQLAPAWFTPHLHLLKASTILDPCRLRTVSREGVIRLAICTYRAWEQARKSCCMCSEHGGIEGWMGPRYNKRVCHMTVLHEHTLSTCTVYSCCQSSRQQYLEILTSCPEMASPAVLFAALSIVYFVWRYFNSTDIPKIKNLPEPPGVPIFGNLLQFGSRHSQTATELSKKYGPVFQTRFGNRVSRPRICSQHCVE